MFFLPISVLSLESHDKHLIFQYRGEGMREVDPIEPRENAQDATGFINIQAIRLQKFGEAKIAAGKPLTEL
jgi:hypothetical protein